MNKLGIERRMLTAGENKGALDPFSPLKPEDEAHAQKLLDEVHQQFIEAVRQGRGDRLADNDDIFSGLFWSGLTAKEYGLIDGFGDADYVARELVGEESLVDFTTVEDPFERFARRLGMGMVEGFKILATASAPLLD
jgi:protease-4